MALLNLRRKSRKLEDSEYNIEDFYEVVSKDDEGVIKIAAGPFEGMTYKYNNFKTRSLIIFLFYIDHIFILIHWT